jgi:hypothetical protein
MRRMRHRRLTATIAAVVLLAAVVALAAVYGVNAQGPSIPPARTPATQVVYGLNAQGTPVPFLAYPGAQPHLNDPLPPADSLESVICGHHLAVHWEGRVLVVDGPDGTSVTKPCGTPDATPDASPSAGQ